MWVIAFITLNRGLVPWIRVLGITFTSFAVFSRKETNIAARHIHINVYFVPIYKYIYTEIQSTWIFQARN